MAQQRNAEVDFLSVKVDNQEDAVSVVLNNSIIN
jgi:hypothetical protein